MSAESIPADWRDAQAMRVTVEDGTRRRGGPQAAFQGGGREEKEIIRSLARLEKKAVTSAAGLRLGKQEGRMDFCDRHVVVTGGTGALGRAVIDALLRRAPIAMCPTDRRKRRRVFPAGR